MPDNTIPTQEQIDAQVAIIRKRRLLKVMLTELTEDDMVDFPQAVQDALLLAKHEFDTACPTLSAKIKKIWLSVRETCPDIEAKFTSADEYILAYKIDVKVETPKEI